MFPRYRHCNSLNYKYMYLIMKNFKHFLIHFSSYNSNFHFHKFRVVSSLIFIFFEKIRLPDIPNDIPRHIPIPIPAMLFNEFIKTTLQSIAAIIPMVIPIIILLHFIMLFISIYNCYFASAYS